MTSPIRPTTILDAPKIARELHLASLTLATETFQVTGSFKFRAAYNLAANVSHPIIIAASSGNFGQALACACELLGKRAIIVMPANSAKVKVDAVRSYNAIADLIDTSVISREARVAELAAENPEAYIASAFDDQLVIDGNATLAVELAALAQPKFDAVIAPVGGGGLASGLIEGFRRVGTNIKVVGAEPALANDAARSLQAGHIVRNNSEPQTIADGARTRALGTLNWATLQHGVAGIIEVPDARIEEAVRRLFTEINLKAEPTGALSLGALLTDPAQFEGKHICCVISGGNVDAAVYARIIQGG